MRIYELSKQLGVSNKDVLERLPELGIVVKSHASSLTPEDVKAVVKLFKPDAFELKKTPPPAKTPAPPPAPKPVSTPAPVAEPPSPAAEPAAAIAVEPTPAPLETPAPTPAPESVSTPAPSSLIMAPPTVKIIVEAPATTDAVEPKKKVRPPWPPSDPSPTRETAFPRGPAPSRPGNRPGGGRPKRSTRRKPRVEDRIEPPKKTDETPATPAVPVVEEILLREGITVKELAEKLSVPPVKLIPQLMKLGVMASINQRISLDIAELVATENGFKTQRENLFKAAELATPKEDARALRPRAPIVTVMGHVDHGKTRLLDAIRKTDVMGGEAGGITQHIGAYSVTTPSGRICFIDTPGHEAFTAMRARGASVTDLVILVVAADDGIMPQTEEAIHHAQAANVPIIVAINKCDLPAANPDRVKQQLAERNLASEDWGGSTITVPVSALKGEGIEKLLEMILLQAEMMELKAADEGRAEGIVIEANLDKARGPVGTVLVKSGLLDVGDTFVCGTSCGKVRALFDSDGRRIEQAGPSTPVLVLGFSEVPAVGDILQETVDEREARYIASERSQIRKGDTIQKSVRVSLDDLKRQADEAGIKELAVVVKADAQGSLEAIRDVLERISDSRVRLRVLHGAVGAVNDNDINLAAAGEALVLGFNVRAIGNAESLAERLGVEIRYYSIIYKLEEEIRLAMAGLLSPKVTEKLLGRAEVRQTFRVTKVGMIAGSYVKEGVIRRNARARLVRDGKVVHVGKIGSVRRFKEDVREVGVNFECGIGLENYGDVKNGDIIEAFETAEEAATLEKNA
jgi:translation initiation factor IF-2